MSLETSALGEVVHQIDKLRLMGGRQVSNFDETVDNVRSKVDLVEVDRHLGAVWVLLLLHVVETEGLNLADGDWMLWQVELRWGALLACARLSALQK